MAREKKNKGRFRVVFYFLPLLSCTAYFNTFYNAQTAFQEGLSSHEKALKKYPDSIVVAPPPDAVSKYDRTIEKALKVIETFPKAKKWHDDALLLIGKASFYKKEMPQAIRRFRQLEHEFPASPLLPEAYLYLGKACIEEGNLDKAEEILLSAQKRFPHLNDNYQISMLLIMIAIRREGKSQAIQLLEQTMKSVKSEELRIAMMLRTAELYIELKQYQKAILILKKTPRRKEFPLQSYRRDMALFTCHKAMDSLNTAYRHLLAMIGTRQYDIYMDEMLFEKGRILHMMGEIDEAIKVYKKLTSGIDSASVAGDTSSFKARALLELALIYQKNREDYRNAQSYLKLAASVRDTATKNFARSRLSAMEKLAKLRSEERTRDSLSGRRLFSIGELFRFELDEPDSAWIQFLKISSDTTLDTALRPKALCQAALIARDDLHDTLSSDSLFRLIIDRYPATEYGKTAQKELRMPLTIKTRIDSAYEAFLAAEKLFYDQNDVKGSVRAFFELSKQYSELPIAPKSLFAAAWFTDNVLLKKQTAKTLYERICSKYPQSVYCTSESKPRLKIVVDTLEKLEKLRKENEEKRTAARKIGKAAQGKAEETRSERGGMMGNSLNSGNADLSSEPLTSEEIADSTATSKEISAPHSTEGSAGLETLSDPDTAGKVKSSSPSGDSEGSAQ